MNYLKKLWKTVFITSSLFVITENSFAYGFIQGYVKDVRVERNGKVLLTFDREAVNTPPECSIGSRRNMAFTLKSIADSGMLSAALTAQSTGKMLVARGSGACESWGSIENAVYVVVKGSE